MKKYDLLKQNVKETMFIFSAECKSMDTIWCGVYSSMEILHRCTVIVDTTRILISIRIWIKDTEMNCRPLVRVPSQRPSRPFRPTKTQWSYDSGIHSPGEYEIPEEIGERLWEFHCLEIKVCPPSSWCFDRPTILDPERLRTRAGIE